MGRRKGIFSWSSTKDSNKDNHHHQSRKRGSHNDVHTTKREILNHPGSYKTPVRNLSSTSAKKLIVDNKNISNGENDQKRSSVSAASSSSASQHHVYSSASAATAAAHLESSLTSPDPESPLHYMVPSSSDQFVIPGENKSSMHPPLTHPQHQPHSHLSSHVKYPSTFTETPTEPLSSTVNTAPNGNDHNIYVSPIPDTSTAADHLWRVQTPDLIGAIHALQILHQAILHESSSPYGNISLDPAELFLCIQSASLRFQSFWEQQKEKKRMNLIHQKRRKSRRRSHRTSDNTENSLSKSNSQHSHLSSINTPSIYSAETVTTTSINGTAPVTTNTDSPLAHEVHSPHKNITTDNNNNENVETARATAKLSPSITSRNEEDTNIHSNNNNRSPSLPASKININNTNINYSNSEKDTNIPEDNTKQAKNNLSGKLSDTIISTANNDNMVNQDSKNKIANSSNPFPASNDNSSSSLLENHYGPLDSMAEDQDYYNNQGLIEEDEFEEQIYQIWEESIGAIAALTTNIIGPAWKHQVNQRRIWSREGRIKSRNRKNNFNKNRMDDSVSSLGMSSIKHQINPSQQLPHHLGNTNASVNFSSTMNGGKASSFKAHNHPSNVPYPNDDLDHNNTGSSSCSNSIVSNPQSAVHIQKNPNNSESSNIRSAKHKKDTNSWNSQDYNLNMMMDGENSNSQHNFPLIPEVLPTALLRFIAIASESFFPPLKRENTSIRLPSKYESISKEIEKEQRWLIRRQRIGALQRVVVLSLFISHDDDQSNDDNNTDLQSFQSGKLSSQTNSNHTSSQPPLQQSPWHNTKKILSCILPGSNGPIASMMVFWLCTATTRWPEIHAYLEQDDPDFEEAIEDLIISSSVNSGEVLWGDIAEVGAVDWWYTLQVCHAASDLVLAGWKPPPKGFGPDCVVGLLSIAKKGIWLFAPNTINYEEDDVMKFDFEDTQLEAREERLAAASCAADIMSTLARLGIRGAIPVLSIECVVNGLCGILAIADLTDNFGSDVEAYPLPEVLSPDIDKNQKIKEELELERNSFFSQFNSYLTDTAELLWVMVAHQSSACSTVDSLLNVMNVRLSKTSFPVSVVCGSFSQDKSKILTTGGAIRALGAALWGNPTQVKGIPSLRIYWARFLTVLSQISSSLYGEKPNDPEVKTVNMESLQKPLSQNSNHPFLPSAISINSAKSFVTKIPELITFPDSSLCDIREYSPSSLIVILEVVLALRRLVDGEMIHSIDTLCVDEWEPFIKILSGLLPWLDHSYAEKISSYPFVEDDSRSQNLLLFQRIHSEVLAIFHQVHLFLTYPINSDIEAPLANNKVMDDTCRRRIFILFLRAASPLFPAAQSNLLSTSILKAWASGGPLSSRYHTWHRTVSDILLETFAVYDDPSCGFPGGYVHSPLVQSVAFDSILECYYEQSQQSQNTDNHSYISTNSINEEKGSIEEPCTLSSNMLSDQMISLLIDFLAEVLTFNTSSFSEHKQEPKRIVLLSSRFRDTLSNDKQSNTVYQTERSHLCKKSIEIMGELFRRPCTKRSDRISIMKTFHYFAADLSFLSEVTLASDQNEEMMQCALFQRLETIKQIGLCFHSCFDQKSFLHETAPMVMNILCELIRSYSKLCQNEIDLKKAESLSSENARKILICASFIHLARLRTSHDNHAVLLGINQITKDSLLDIPLLGNSFHFAKKVSSELREHYSHILGSNKSNANSTTVASFIFLEKRSFKQSIKTKSKISQANLTSESKNSSRNGQVKTLLDLNIISSTIQTVLQLASHSIIFKHGLMKSSNQAQFVTNQLIYSCQFDICLRILCNRTIEGFLRGGIFYPLDLKLHSPEYPNHTLFDQLQVADLRAFSALLAISSCLLEQEKQTENQRLDTTNTAEESTQTFTFLPKDRQFFDCVLKSISSDDWVVSTNSCRCLSLLVSHHYALIENEHLNLDDSNTSDVSNLKDLSLNVLSDRLLDLLNHFSKVSKATGESNQPTDSIHSLDHDSKLVPLLSAIFDIISHSTKKPSYKYLSRKTKLHTVKACSHVLRKTEFDTSFQSRLLALQCCRALICTMESDDILISLADIIKSKNIRQLNVSSSTVDPTVDPNQEEENISLLDIIIDMLNRQNTRISERHSNKEVCSLSMNQKMSKDIEELDAFAVNEHDPTATGAWLCGNSILMLRKGSPTSRYRGWLEITIRSPTSRIRKLMKLSPLIFVRNPEFPSPLWGILLPSSEESNCFDEKSNSGSTNSIKIGCEQRLLVEAKHQIHRHEIIHSGSTLEFQSDSANHSTDNENLDVSQRTGTTSNATGEADLNDNFPNFLSEIFKKSSDQMNYCNDDYSNFQSIDSHEDSLSQRHIHSNHDAPINIVQNISVLKRSLSVNDIFYGHEVDSDDRFSAEKSSRNHDIDEFLKSVSDSSKDHDCINSFLHLQGLLPLNGKMNKKDGSCCLMKEFELMQQLKYSFRLRRAIDILDRTSFLQTYKIALLYAGKNETNCDDGTNKKSGFNEENMVLNTSNSSLEFIEFCRGLGTYVPTRHLKHFSGGLDTSSYSADGKFALSWIDESYYSDERTGHLFSHSMVLFHTVPLMPSGINNRKRHVGNDNVHIVYVEDVSSLGSGISIHDIIEDNIVDKQDPVVSGQFGFVTIFVLPLSNSNLINVSVKIRSGLDMKVFSALRHLIGTNIVSKTMASSFVRQMAMRADLACRSTLQDRLGNFSNWQERLHQIRDLSRYIE